jgi:D-alanine-D-alanine ligase
MKIALVLGGISAEREVSLLSGAAMLDAIKKLGYDYVLIDPVYGDEQPKKEEDFFRNGKNFPKEPKNYLKAINSEFFDNVDIALLALHGQFGEDGLIQSLFELRGIPYTGSGVLPSSIAMDKAVSKILFTHFDVQTPKWILLRDENYDLNLTLKKIEKFFGYPCVVKPSDQGSTIGLTVCNSQESIEGAIAKAFEFGSKVLIEEFIDGREIAVGIIGKEALPVLEIIPKHGLYDYECKYSDGMSFYETPAKIPDTLAKRLQQQALLAYQAVGCQNYGRVDFRLSKNFESYCLEVNTLPGMTSHSLMPKMAAAKGMSYADLVEKIIRLSL